MSAHDAIKVVTLVLETAVGGLLVFAVIAVRKLSPAILRWAAHFDEELGRIRGEIGRLESRIDELAEDVVAAPREEENDAAI